MTYGLRAESLAQRDPKFVLYQHPLDKKHVRLQVVFLALIGMGLLCLAWQGAKLWLRRGIRVEQRESAWVDTLFLVNGLLAAPTSRLRWAQGLGCGFPLVRRFQ